MADAAVSRPSAVVARLSARAAAAALPAASVIDAAAFRARCAISPAAASTSCPPFPMGLPTDRVLSGIVLLLIDINPVCQSGLHVPSRSCASATRDDLGRID